MRVISSFPPRFSLFSANTALKLVGPKNPAGGLPWEFLSVSAVRGSLEEVEYIEGSVVATTLEGDTTVLEPVVGVSGKVIATLEMGSDCLLLIPVLLESASLVRVIGAVM